jgi:antitoxin (DNA-binding transcriptional repressor) of toxin-antitoxin stability system
MRWITIRDLRNTPGKVRRWLAREDLILTSGGTPVAYLVGIEGEDPEEVTALMRRARAERAVSRMRREAAERGLDAIPPEEVKAEIRKVRSRRKTGR